MAQVNIFRPNQRIYDLSGTIEFKMRVAVAEANWWLLGGDVPIFAYDAAAASYAASKVNLANPGTYDLIDTGHVPDWDGVGWTMSVVKYFETGFVPPDGSYTILFEPLQAPTGYFFGESPFTGGNVNLALRIPVNTIRFYSGAIGATDFSPVPTSGKVIISNNIAYWNGTIMSSINNNNVPIAGAVTAIRVGSSNPYTGTGKFAKFALWAGVLSPAKMIALTAP